MFIRNAITTEAVLDMAKRMEIGSTLNAEVFSRPTVGSSDSMHIEKVTILEKYPHFALTDYGPVTWANLAIHNRSQLRKELLR